jgi:glutathione S-transferase
MPLIADRIRVRLGQLSRRLGGGDWLDGAFSAGDLKMVSVLLRLRAPGLPNEFANLAAYVARSEARPDPRTRVRLRAQLASMRIS